MTSQMSVQAAAMKAAVVDLPWWLDGRIITIHGRTGEAVGDHWLICGKLRAPEPGKIRANLEALVEYDRERGREHLVAAVHVGAVNAVMMFLDRTLTVEMLEQAEVSLGQITVQMELGGRLRQVVIVPQCHIGSYESSTRDADGNVV